MTNIKRIVTSFWIIRFFMRASYCSQDWTVNVKYFKDFNCVKVNKTTQKPCSLSQPLSWMKPMKGAMPVPGPTMITGLVALKGRRNWDLRINIGTVDLWPLSDISLFFSQLVATPLLTRPVFVWYSTTTAQMWMLLGWTFTTENYKQVCGEQEEEESPKTAFTPESNPEPSPRGANHSSTLPPLLANSAVICLRFQPAVVIKHPFQHFRLIGSIEITKKTGFYFRCNSTSYLGGGGDGIIASLETR